MRAKPSGQQAALSLGARNAEGAPVPSGLRARLEPVDVSGRAAINDRAADVAAMLEPISPELALVDAELAERARRHLPDSPPVAPRIAERPPEPATLVRPPSDEQVESERPRAHYSRLAKATVLFLAPIVLTLAVGIAALTLEPRSVFGGEADSQAPRSPQGVARNGAGTSEPAQGSSKRRASGVQRRGRTGTRSRRTPPAGRRRTVVVPAMLRWSAVAGATHYRVMVYKFPPERDRLLFEAWTFVPRLVPPLSWMTGRRRHELTPGRYLYRVYVVLRRRSRAGNRVKSGSFIVRRTRSSRS